MPEPAHIVKVARFVRGHTATRPTRPLYGTAGRCSCGWTGRCDRALSAGGRRWIADDHRRDTGQPAEIRG